MKTPKKKDVIVPSPVLTVQELEAGNRKGKSPELNTAIESLVEGVQELVSGGQSPVPGNETVYETGNQSSLLLFVDESDEEDESNLNQKSEITLSEASYYFPALAKSRAQESLTTDNLIARSATDVNPYLTQVNRMTTYTTKLLYT